MPKTDEKKADKHSRVRELWNGIEKDYGESLASDLSYIDALPDDDRVRDEFVRLPYDVPRDRQEYRW